MTDLPDVPVGAMWRCFDLHLHTPGVHSFALPPGVDVQKAADREHLADEYVQRLADAGIEVAAIRISEAEVVLVLPRHSDAQMGEPD